MTSLENHSRIPIKNIYYMLVYAWDHPHEKNFISVIEEDEKDLINLLSKVLLLKVKSLIKKGFYKEYVHSQDESSIVRGKLLFKETLQSFSYKRGKVHIQEEEMTYNILHNQLIKATLHHLAQYQKLKKEYREELSKVLSYFEKISLIKVSSSMFSNVTLHRNNQHYQFLLTVCKFIWENALLHEGEAERQFQDFNRDHQRMAQLFENFVKNFYRRELPGSLVKSESFHWAAKGERLEYLPKMKTDISLEYNSQKVIIDTKFYKDMFTEHWERETVRSSHLYQLFAYLKNDEYYRGKKAQGILLYPKVHKSINLQYEIHGYEVKVCTLDLTEHWSRVHERLVGMVDYK